MGEGKYKVVTDPRFGYRRLDPVPTEAELGEFYQSRYYDLVRKGGRAPELRRLMAGGPEAEKERAWLRSTLHADVVDVLKSRAPGARVLEVGCGSGDLLLALREEGLRPEGLDPAEEACRFAASRGLTVHRAGLQDYAARPGGARFDAVLMMNVLEHVPEPAAFLEQARGLLAPGGLLGVRVPNDFNALQIAAKERLGREPWWIAVPDHVNYFDYDSLGGLLDRLGFDVVHAQGDFPMELFLLMGEDYAGDPALGAACHARRIAFETALPAEERRRLYRALAEAGMGRNCLVFGRSRR